MKQLEELMATGAVSGMAIGFSVTKSTYFCTLNCDDAEPVGSGHGDTIELAIVDAIARRGHGIKMPGMEE